MKMCTKSRKNDYANKWFKYSRTKKIDDVDRFTYPDSIVSNDGVQTKI